MEDAERWSTFMAGGFTATLCIFQLLLMDSVDRVRRVSPEAAVYARVLGTVALWPLWLVYGVARSLYTWGRDLRTFLFQRKNKEE